VFAGAEDKLFQRVCQFLAQTAALHGESEQGFALHVQNTAIHGLRQNAGQGNGQPFRQQVVPGAFLEQPEFLYEKRFLFFPVLESRVIRLKVLHTVQGGGQVVQRRAGNARAPAPQPGGADEEQIVFKPDMHELVQKCAAGMLRAMFGISQWNQPALFS
jgi:hypothetical protein